MKNKQSQSNRSVLFSQKLPFLKGRDRGLRALRSYFQGKNFLEVTTPALQASPGMEPHLRAFRTILEDPVGPMQTEVFLHTSPEFAMKKLLASGSGNIFQVASVFRNRERSRTHHPEFSMLEWYRVEEGLDALIEDCEQLLLQCKQAIGSDSMAHWQHRDCDLSLPFERISVQDVFLKYAETDLLGTIEDPLKPKPELLREACRKLGIFTDPADSWEDLFFRIFLEKIEHKLGVGRGTILFDYPISMAALARPKPRAPHLAERFELYVCGLELANAFSELTDPVEQRKRFRSDQEKKLSLYGEQYPMDEDFLAALEEGLPISSGIALGVDRLMMLLTGAESIEDVLWVPVLRSLGQDA